jgi:hypothetical protein
MAKDGSSKLRAIAILAAAGVAAFVVSTAAVSASGSTGGPSRAARAASITYPFSRFSLTGGVSADVPSEPRVFSLTFPVSFTLAPNSQGIINPTNGKLNTVTVEQDVAYPVPAAGAAQVGPVALPFSSDSLSIIVVMNSFCWSPNTRGVFTFKVTAGDCDTVQLVLNGTSYDVSSLVTSISGSMSPKDAAKFTWSGKLKATFVNPGYTFPIATLGSAGGTILTIGQDGGVAATRSVSFSN